MAEESFDPYLIWLGIPPKDQPPNHYRLLAVELFESLPAVIENAADQRMAYLRSLQVGKHGQLSQQILNELATAKRCLLNPPQKAAYDLALQTKISASTRRSAPATVVSAVASPQPLPVARPLSTNRAEPGVPAAIDEMAGVAADYSRPRAARKRSRQGSPLPLIAGGVGVLVLLGLALGYAAFRTDDSEPSGARVATAARPQHARAADPQLDEGRTAPRAPIAHSAGASLDAPSDTTSLAPDGTAYASDDQSPAADETANATGEKTTPMAQEPASPQLPELQPLTDQLNTFAEWVPESGKWSSAEGFISGEGESMLKFRQSLPADFELAFEMNVVRGLRPRIHLGGTNVYFGNEGFDRNLWAHGSGALELVGAPFRYDNNQWLKCVFRFEPQRFEILIDGKPVVTGKRQSHGLVELALQAGDGWSPGATQWRGFRIAGLNAPDDAPPDLAMGASMSKGKLAQPTPSARAAALRAIRHTYADDFRSAKTPAAKAALAAKLLKLGLGTTDNPATRYVLLEQARVTASAADEKALVEQATSALAASFQADENKSDTRAPGAADLQRTFDDCVLLLSFDKNALVEHDGKAGVADLSNAHRQGVFDGRIAVDKGRAGPGLALAGGTLQFNAPLFSGATSYTVLLWFFKPDDHAPLTLYSEHVGDGNLCGLLEIKEDASVKLSAWNWSGRESWVHAVTPAGSVPLNQWNFLALTLDDGGFERGKIAVQINKQVVELPSQQISAGVSFRLGGNGNGAIDEVAVFRRALTRSELGHLYELGLKRKPLSQTLAKKPR